MKLRSLMVIIIFVALISCSGGESEFTTNVEETATPFHQEQEEPTPTDILVVQEPPAATETA